jgi:hypothetical protein
VGFLVDLDDLHLDGLADRQDLGGVVDAAPGHVGDVQQAVDTAEIDEGAVFGDVLDHAVDDVALGQLADDLGALFGAASSRMARRETTMLPRRRSILRIWKGCLSPSAGRRRAPGAHRPGSRAGTPRRRPDRR